MANYLPLPNGAYYPIAEGQDPRDAWQRAMQKYPEAFETKQVQPEKKPESGFFPALKATYSSLKSEGVGLAGRAGLMDLDEAKKYIEEQKKYQADTWKPTEKGWLEDPITHVTELAGQSLPYMVAPALAGAAVAGGAALAPEAAVAAGLAEALPAAAELGAGTATRYGLTSAGSRLATGLAGATSAGQFTASNIARQTDEGKNLEDTDLIAASLASIPQAALDTFSLHMIPGLGKVFERAGLKLGKEEVRNVAEEGLKKTATDYLLKTGKTMGIEGLTEAGQQIFERAQAGLSITDPEARQEYFDNFIGGAVLGGLVGLPGRYVERGHAQARYDMGEAAKQQTAQQEQLKLDALAAAEEEKKKSSPEYFQTLSTEYKAAERAKSELAAQKRDVKKGSETETADRLHNKEIEAQISQMNPGLDALAAEYNNLLKVQPKAEEVAAMPTNQVALAVGDTLDNPLGNFTKEELASRAPTVAKYIDAQRKNAGKPALETYSIEDIRNAMPNQLPEAEQADLSSLIAAKSGHTGDITYKPTDVLEVAKQKNIDTTTEGFKDFLRRATGDAELEKLTQPQLHSAFTALASLPKFDEPQILPQKRNATDYSKEQYDKAVAALQKLVEDRKRESTEVVKEGEKPIAKLVTIEEANKTIKDQTGLKKDEDAQRLFRDANRNGDIDFKGNEVTYQPKGAQAEFNIEEGTAPAEGTGFNVMRDGKMLFATNDEAEATAKAEKLGKDAAPAIQQIDKSIARENATVADSQKAIDAMEAEGKFNTPQYTQAAARHAGVVDKANKTIANLNAKKQMLQKPVTVQKAGKPTNRKIFIVKEKGVEEKAFNTRQEAEQHALENLPEERLNELASQTKAKGFANRLKKEQERRKRPVLALPAPKPPAPKGPSPEAKALEGKLLPMLRRFGLGDVALKIEEGMRDEGSYKASVIKIALDASNPFGVLRHEVIHGLKDLGFFTPGQWKVLENKANKEWIDTYLKQRNVDGGTLKAGEQSRFDAYMKEYNGDMDAVREEAIADAFRDFDVNGAPKGMFAQLLNAMRKFFRALHSALTGVGYESAEDIFGKVERGELKAAKAAEKEEPTEAPPKEASSEDNAWQATPKDIVKAEKYEEKNGIAPYVSAGKLDLPIQTPKYSLKSIDKYGFDPFFGVPLNKDGTITVFYHTTKAKAAEYNKTKVIPSGEGNRIYLTNESSGAKVLENTGNFDQEIDGSVVIMKLPPSMLHLDEEYSDGRKDFFIPTAQGEFFDRKMRMSAIQVSKNTPILGEGQKFSYKEHEDRIRAALQEYLGLSAADQKKRLKEAKTVLKKEHNIGTLLTENGKLEKTRENEVGLQDMDENAASMGLGLAAAQRITDKLSTCPNAAICMDLCLGDTAGGNMQYGGVAAKDVNGIEKSAFRAGPRMAQYLKTEAMIIHPEEFAIVLNAEIANFKAWAKKETQRVKNPETGKSETVAKEVYTPSIRLNVTSDFKASTWLGLMEANPDVVFYDYTKVNAEPAAPNNHLTYSSTGFGQIIDGKKVSHKTNNWHAMEGRLNRGYNVAMAFTSKSALPDFVVDEATGKSYKVWDGDNYDARYLDPTVQLTRDGDKVTVGRKPDETGMIIGLRNKAGTMKESESTVDTDGFFADYDPKRDGNVVKIPDQSQFGFPSTGKKTIPIAKASLRTNTPEFKKWFGDSKIVDADGNPKVMYHGTARDITEFKPKQANAIFLTDSPRFAEVFSDTSKDYIVNETFQALPDATKDKVIKDAIRLAKQNGLINPTDAKFAYQTAMTGGNLNKYGINWHLAKFMEPYLPSGPNIMPLFVRAKNPFDFAQYDEDGLDALLNKNPKVKDKHKTEIDKWALSAIANGSWEQIEKSNVQERLKDLGFDSFYVMEGGTKNLAVYEPSQIKSATGNEGTYDINNPDIRKSLRVKETIGINVNQDGSNKYADKIVDGEKIFETRDTDSLRPYVGQRVAIVKTGEGKAKAIGAVTIGEPILVTSRKDFDKYRNQTLVPKGSRFDITDGGVKYLYPMDNPERYKQEIDVGLGIVSRKVTQERASLRTNVKNDINSMPNGAAIWATMNRVTPPREVKTFAERITRALAPESWSYIRQNFVDRYNRLNDYDKMVAKQMGGIDLLADQSAHWACLNSDMAAGITASALGVGDRMGGTPVLKNGYVTVSNLNGTVKGVVDIIAPLARHGNPDIYRSYQLWSAAKRGTRLYREGRFELLTPQEIKDALTLEQKYPEFAKVQEDWIKYNNGLVKMQVEGGVLTKEAGQEFMKYSDYIPLYRQMDGESTVGPSIYQSISGVKAPKTLTGKGTAPIEDYLETIVRNTQAAIQATMKNVAAQKAVKNGMILGIVTRLPAVSSSPDTITILENGKKVSYQCADKLWVEAVSSLNLPELPFLSILAKPADMLRTLVTKDPGFMLANMMRDSLSAYITSGANINPVVSTVKNYGAAMMNRSPVYQALLNAGALGGYEFSRNVEAGAEALSKDLRKKTGTQTGAEKLFKPFTGVWDFLERGTEASDAATRMAVYEATMKETGNEGEAIRRALEVMNFNRKGRSAVVRIAAAAIPFLNARVQGLDVFFRAGIRPFYDKNATAYEKQVQKAMLIRGATVMALSTMYAAAVMGDPDYEKQEQETKDNFWLIPSLGIKIPIPFEVGTLFKTIPERIYRYYYGADTSKDLGDSMKRALQSTFAFNPVPQAVAPLMEARDNYSVFTQRPIVSEAMKNIAPEYQVGPSTTKLAEFLGKQTGMSPILIDHVYKGYTGTMGMYLADVMDSVYSANSDNPKASQRFEQTPVLKRFLLDPEARGQVSSFYDLKHSVDQTVRTINLLEKQGSPELGDYMSQNISMYGMKKYVSSVDTQMQKLNAQAALIRSTPMPADEKRKMLDEITKIQNELTNGVQLMRKMARP
jgi:predicted transcriptional regulator